uniref:Polyamine aminopropyltransferase n=1 Tax=uncultured Thiotrichaceae bacterium TaxID=298394 RepID=A0A6S6SHV0_9GAMM|nr:MAG: Spermidine synthase (EC [uncultured Thiotrichaceae bacterium]
MTTTPNWFTELSDAGTIFGLELTDSGRVHVEQTPFQKLEVFDTKTFGKLMTLDGCTMVSSRDNFVYHEMMAHPVLFSHPSPKRVCIIGGGDCGTLKEVLRHPEVESAIQIDIDERVTRVSEQYFPELCESNNDPRATLAFEDGIKWIQDAEPGSLDVLIVDSTDPVGPGAVLYSEAFFQSCWRALGDEGLLVQQSESPLVHAEKIIKPMHDTMRRAGFTAVQLHQFPLVSYPTGWWSCSIAAKQGEVAFRREQSSENSNFPTQYYDAAMHRGSLALPPFLARLLR